MRAKIAQVPTLLLLSELLSLPVERCKVVTRETRVTVIVRAGGETLRVLLRNTGRLLDLVYPGAEGLLVRRRGAKTQGAFVGSIVGRAAALIDTYIQMKALEVAHARRLLPWLTGWQLSTRGVSFGGSRFDYSLVHDGRRGLMEVKSAVNLVGNFAVYPDAPSRRGLQHVRELIRIASLGLRAVVAFIAAHPLARGFRPCHEVHPELANELTRAAERGVEVRAVKMRIELDGRIVLDNPDLPVYLRP